MGGRSVRSGGCEVGARATPWATSAWTNTTTTSAATSVGSKGAATEAWHDMPDLQSFPKSGWPWSQQGSAAMSVQFGDCAIGHGSCAEPAEALGATPTNKSRAARATMVEISRRFELLGALKDARMAVLRQGWPASRTLNHSAGHPAGRNHRGVRTDSWW